MTEHLINKEESQHEISPLEKRFADAIAKLNFERKDLCEDVETMPDVESRLLSHNSSQAERVTASLSDEQIAGLFDQIQAILQRLDPENFQPIDFDLSVAEKRQEIYNYALNSIYASSDPAHSPDPLFKALKEELPIIGAIGELIIADHARTFDEFRNDMAFAELCKQQHAMDAIAKEYKNMPPEKKQELLRKFDELLGNDPSAKLRDAGGTDSPQAPDVRGQAPTGISI